MKSIARSLSQFFDRLTYSQRFTMITLVFVIPVIAFTPLITDQITNIRRYGISELSGTIYLRSLWKLSEDLQDYVTAAHQYSDGEIQLSELQAIQSTVEVSLNAFQLTHIQYGESLQLGNNADTIKNQWSDVKVAVQNSDWDTFKLHQSTLFESIASLTSQVGDLSYLILDPDLDTYYMMDTVLIKGPENQSLAFETNQLAEQAVVHGTFTAEEKTQLIILIGRLEANLDAMNRNIGIAIQNDQTGEMAGIISSPLDNYQNKLRKYSDLVYASLNSASNAPIQNPEKVFNEIKTAYLEVHRSDLEFYNGASASLELGIRHRITVLTTRLILMTAIALLSIIGAFGVGRSMMKSISQPLAELISATQLISSGNLSTRVRINVSGELGQVGTAFNQMAAELEREKSALVTRSTELESAHKQSEKRAQLLQNIGEISRILSSEQRLDILLPLTARIVSEKFNFYHVGFFLLDDKHEYAVLQAANSAGGKRMLERGHKLKIGQVGIVGYVAATGNPRIALNVGDDAVYFNNPDLPDTRSELALPIRISDELIGVLDVQSTQPNAFHQEDADILTALADQIAIAIQNARSYATTQELLQEAQKISKSFMSESWRIFQEEQPQIGYRISKEEVQPLQKSTTSEQIRKAIDEKVTVAESGKKATLAVPIWLRNEVVGVLDIRVLEEHEWDPDDVDIVEAVADRLSLAIESSLLLRTTQRRAEIERITTDISGKIGATTQFDSILRTAAEELSRVLGGSEVLVQIQPLESFGDNGNS